MDLHTSEPCRRAKDFASRPHHLHIGGEWVPAASEETFSSYDPSTGAALSTIAAASETDVDRAVRSAQTALEGSWHKVSPAQRQRLLWRLSDLLEKHAEEFAILESLDSGKPLRDARLLDIPGAINSLRYFAGWATKLNGETVSVSPPGEWHAYTVREPVGVVGLILPWNAPLMMAAAKLAPALAAGCTVILKPAEQTPLTALRLAELSVEAGFPPGVINVLTGFGVPLGQAIVDHPGVNKISFTGSTAVGKSIIRRAANDLKRITLELGGKSPVIVMPDADLAKAIPAVARGIFGNTGQVCNAGSRLYAHQAVFDQVIEGILEQAGSLRIGPGLDPETQMGPVVSQAQLERVSGYIDAGRKEGATVLRAGTLPQGDGYFVSPTVLADTSHAMTVVREEIFGPVLCGMRINDHNELDAIAAQANDSAYGLGAMIWTKDLSVAHKLARRLKAGTVRINGGGLDPALPFGGFKSSGWGRENGREGIDAYTELKSVMVAL